MKITVFLIFLWLLFAPETSAAKEQSDRNRARLVGNVRMVREFRTFSKFKLKSAELLKLLKELPYYNITYNKEGDLVEEDYLYGLRYTYSFSDDGFRLKTANGDTSPNSGNLIPPYVAEREADKFDRSGKKIETVTYLWQEEKSWIRHTYEYDDKDRLHKVFYYTRVSDGSLKLFRTITFSLEANGDEKEVSWRDATGGLMDKLSYSNYKHDSKGNWIERTEARVQIYDKDQPKEQWGTIYRIISYY